MLKIFEKFFKHQEPPMASKRLTTEEAWLRTSFFSTKQLEEWNPDELVQYKGGEIYKKMLRDPQIKAAYNLLVDIIIQRDWFFEVDEEDPEQEKLKDFFEFNLKNLKSTFSQSMRNILLAKAHGFSLTEKIFGVHEYEGQEKWTIEHLKQKPFDSFSFDVDKFGNVLSISQNTGNQRRKLDKNKFIHFVNYPELDPIWGESDLRSIYRAYWEKQNILTFWNIYLERTAGGFLTATPKDDSISLSPKEKNDFDAVLRNINQSTAMRVPAGFEIDMKNGVNTKAFEEAVAHRDRQISKGLLVPNLLGFSEQGSTGSFAQSKTQLETFLFIVNYQAEQLAEALNEQLFSQLAWVNFGLKEYPKFKFENRTEDQKQEVAKIWFEALKTGAVTNTEQDELKTRELLGYPTDIEIEEQPEEKPEAPQTQPQEEEMSAEFIDMNDPPWLQRMNFADIEQLLDSNEFAFYEDLSKQVDKLFSTLKKSIRESIAGFKPGKANYKSTVEKVDKSFSENDLKKLNKVINEHLKTSYDDGRQIGQDTIRSAIRTLPKKERQRIKFSISNSQKKGIAKQNWSVLDFVENVRLQTADKFFREKAFFITGTLSESMIDAAKQAILNGIEKNMSTQEIIDELEQILGPLTGKTITNPETGKNEPSEKAERARLETIVRTNLIDAFNQSLVNVYTDPDLNGFVKGLEYQSILDSRTTKFCRRYDGFKRSLTDPIWGSITPPNHFNCRATLVPITMIDPNFKDSSLVKDKEGLVQPNTGFGTVTKKNEI